MATWVKKLSSNYNLELQVYVIGQNIANNTSTVREIGTLVKTAGTGRYDHGTSSNWNSNLNGNTANGNFSYNFNNYTRLELFRRDYVITHNGDGSKTINCKFTVNTSQSQVGSGTINENLTLPTIPRATTPNLSKTVNNFGDSIVINLPRADSSFTHSIYYALPSIDGTWITIANNVGTSYTWTPPLALMNKIPKSRDLNIMIIVRTYKGSTQVGSSTSKTFINRVTSAYAPSNPAGGYITFTKRLDQTMESAQVSGLIQGWDYFQQPFDREQEKAVGKYGATIVQYQMKFGKDALKSYTPSEFLTQPVTEAFSQTGVVPLTIIAIDSRGFSVSWTKNFTIQAWTPPRVTGLSVVRTNASGTNAWNGTSVRVRFKLTVNALSGNTGFIRVSVNGNIDTLYEGGDVINYDHIFSTYDINQSYPVVIQYADSMTMDKNPRYVINHTVTTGTPTLDLRDKMIAIGKFWERGGLDVMQQIYQNNGMVVMGLKKIGSYFGMTLENGSDEGWIRTPKNGIIPYSETSSGTSNLGSNSWPFSAVVSNSYWSQQKRLDLGYIEYNVGSWRVREFQSGYVECRVTTNRTVNINASWGSLYQSPDNSIGGENLPFVINNAGYFPSFIATGSSTFGHMSQKAGTTTKLPTYCLIRPTSANSVPCRVDWLVTGYKA